MNKFIYYLLFLPFVINAQTKTQNYVKKITYKSATTTGNIPADSTAVDVTYFDGLGRPIQQLANKRSGTGKNIVTHIEYDMFGRQVLNYLPYEASTMDLEIDTLAQLNTMNFYTSYGETTYNPYSESFFELSPLSKVLKQAAPGAEWIGSHVNDNDHTVKFVHFTNIEDEVRYMTANSAWDDNKKLYEPSLVIDGYYEENQLYKTIVKDENWTSGNNNTSEEFKNKQGQIILKRTYNAGSAHNTYYIYDQYGNLTYVVPPKAVITGGGITGFEELCYQYKYDHRNRLAEKKIPGRGWEFLVYDNLNRIALTGPAFSPWGGEDVGWMMTKHDALGRVAYTGWYYGVTATSETRKNLQIQVAGQAIFHEDKTGSATSIPSDPQILSCYYTNKIFPILSLKVLTVNFYDNYIFGDAPTNFSAQIENQPIYYNDVLKPKGLSTGSWVRVMGNISETLSESSYILYDYKARPIRTHKKNHLGGFTTVDTKFDFAGKVLVTETEHQGNQSSAVVKTRENFKYDLQDRLVSHTHKINSRPTELIAYNNYDDLGQLTLKQVGGNDISGSGAYQFVDYDYNIRGWLKNINEVGVLLQQSGPEDLFAFQINYTTSSNIASVSPLFNGNISETLWHSASDQIVRKYGYEYDDLNRLWKAYYQKPNTSVPYTAMYDEQINYDMNGNIVDLVRNGNLDLQVGAHTMDFLKYDYDDNSNVLRKVTDLTNDPMGFKDRTPFSAADDYGYDAHGNMTKDENKGISEITYNHLNLPTQIVFSGERIISYIYNAAGQKVSKNVFSPPIVQGEAPLTVTTDYLDGYQYENSILKFFPHAEGYVNIVTEQDMRYYSYVYNYRDHLGNIRLSYSFDEDERSLKILEENHYYPFGLKHTNYSSGRNEIVKEEDPNLKIAPVPPSILSLPYKYKYNGKEWQDELGLNMYDYHARNYDPAIGRWMNIDPKAETSRRFSPYVYALNNPVFFIDPDGMESIDPASQKEWDKQKTAVTARRDAALAVGNAFGGGLGSLNPDVISLNKSLSTMKTLEGSTQNYTLNNTPGDGGVTYNPSTGNVDINYPNTALFVHEKDHAGQFETGNIGFEKVSGAPVAVDIGDEVAAYKSQYAYDAGSVSGLSSNSTVNSAQDITASWVQNLTSSGGNQPYSQGGSNNVGISPLNGNSSTADAIKAYPGNTALTTLPSNWTFKSSFLFK